MGILWNDSDTGTGILWDDADTSAVIPTTTLVTKFDGGNASAETSYITGADTMHPILWLDYRTATKSDLNGWRMLPAAVENVEGKSLTVRWNRETMIIPSSAISSGFIPHRCTDFNDWLPADTRSFVGSSPSRYIEATFDSPLPPGRVYVSTHPYKPNSYSEIFAAELLESYPTIVAPVDSADEFGVYNTSPAETDEDGLAIGENDQFGLKLVWPGATTFGGPKIKALFNAGTHAAGEHFSWLPFEAKLRWLLDSEDEEAVRLRANLEVYIHFNITPNGLTGGHARWNFRTSSDPNRNFVSRTLQEIAAYTAAVEADTGGAVDVFFSWHTWSSYTTLYVIAGDESVTDIKTAFINNFEAIIGATAPKQLGNLTTTGSYWAQNVLGAKLSFEAEMGMRAPTDVASVEQVGITWLLALDDTIEQGYFYTPPEEVIAFGNPQAQPATASGSARRLVTGAGFLQAQNASTNGSGTRSITAAGIVSALTAATSGSAERKIAGSGVTQSQLATASGVSLRVITGAGAATAGSPSATGVGAVGGVVSGAGSASAQMAQATGTGFRLISGVGAVEAQAPLVSGSGDAGGVSTGSGAVEAQRSTGSGLGLRVVRGSGVAIAPTASAKGFGAAGSVVTGTGSSMARRATSTGIALRVITGAGAAVSQNATAFGSGITERVTTGNGQVAAQRATSTGIALRVIVGSGITQAQRATSSGATRGNLSLPIIRPSALDVTPKYSAIAY